MEESSLKEEILKPADEDISRRTIVVLLVLVTVLSVLGTYVVLNEINKYALTQAPVEEPGNVATGKVEFRILPPDGPPPETKVTGRVTLGILDPNKP